MARTLRNNTLTTNLIAVLAVDDDNATIGVWTTPGSSTKLTSGSGLTLTSTAVSGSDQTFGSSTARAIIMDAATDKLVITAGSEIALPTANDTYVSYFAALIDYNSSDRGNIVGSAADGSADYALILNGTTLYYRQADADRTSANQTIPVTGKFGVGSWWKQKASSGIEKTAHYWYGAESGSGTDVSPTTPVQAAALHGTSGGPQLEAFLSNEDFNRVVLGEVMLVAVWSRQLSDAEFQSVHDDPIGALFETGATGVTITNAGDEVFYPGETGIIITGTNFETQGANSKVWISPTDNIADSNKVEQTVTAWTDNQITFTAVKGTLSFLTTAYLFVVAHSGADNDTGYAVAIEPRVYVRETLVDLTNTPVANETGLTVFVWRSDPRVVALGTPNEILTSKTTNGSGVTDWQIARGSIAVNDPVWIAIMKDGTPYRATMRKVAPVYE